MTVLLAVVFGVLLLAVIGQAGLLAWIVIRCFHTLFRAGMAKSTAEFRSLERSAQPKPESWKDLAARTIAAQEYGLDPDKGGPMPHGFDGDV